MSMELWWNDDWQEKHEVLGGKPALYLSVHHISNMFCLGIEPGASR
jgi:hypothetical protein